MVKRRQVAGVESTEKVAQNTPFLLFSVMYK